jgi:hypothetical protein
MTATASSEEFFRLELTRASAEAASDDAWWLSTRRPEFSILSVGAAVEHLRQHRRFIRIAGRRTDARSLRSTGIPRSICYWTMGARRIRREAKTLAG